MDTLELENGSLVAVFNELRQELDEHLDVINENTDEIEGNFSYLINLEKRMKFLEQRLERFEKTLSKVAPLEEQKREKKQIHITDNEQDVFLVIYNSKVAEGTGKGVYVRATASEVFDEKEIEKALAIMWGRVGKDPKAHKSSEFLGNSPLRVYKAVPKKFWINDDERFEGKYLDFRVEVDLLGNK